MLRERGTPVEYRPARDLAMRDDPAVLGTLLAGTRLTDDGVLGSTFRVVARDDLDEQDRALFADWALQRVERYLEHGPDPDAWQRRSDGDYQLTARKVEGPVLEE